MSKTLEQQRTIAISKLVKTYNSFVKTRTKRCEGIRLHEGICNCPFACVLCGQTTICPPFRSELLPIPLYLEVGDKKERQVLQEEFRKKDVEDYNTIRKNRHNFYKYQTAKLCANHYKYRLAIDFATSEKITAYIPNSRRLQSTTTNGIELGEELAYLKTRKWMLSLADVRSLTCEAIGEKEVNSYHQISLNLFESLLRDVDYPWIYLYTSDNREFIVSSKDTLVKNVYVRTGDQLTLTSRLNMIKFAEGYIHPASYYLLPKKIRTMLKPYLPEKFSSKGAPSLFDLCIQYCWSMNIGVGVMNTLPREIKEKYYV